MTFKLPRLLGAHRFDVQTQTSHWVMSIRGCACVHAVVVQCFRKRLSLLAVCLRTSYVILICSVWKKQRPWYNSDTLPGCVLYLVVKRLRPVTRLRRDWAVLSPVFGFDTPVKNNQTTSPSNWSAFLGHATTSGSGYLLSSSSLHSPSGFLLVPTAKMISRSADMLIKKDSWPAVIRITPSPLILIGSVIRNASDSVFNCKGTFGIQFLKCIFNEKHYILT